MDSQSGQAAVEYLMTYGWAILVVLVVGIALWQLGVLTPTEGNKNIRGFTGLKPIDAVIWD